MILYSRKLNHLFVNFKLNMKTSTIFLHSIFSTYESVFSYEKGKKG